MPAALAEALAGQQASAIRTNGQPAPHLTAPEGEVYGQEVWDTTPGIDLMSRFMDGRFSPPVFRLMGIRGLDLSEGEMTIGMPASGWLLNAYGVIYGGSLALLADAAITARTASGVRPATGFSPRHLRVTYPRPVFSTAI